MPYDFHLKLAKQIKRRKEDMTDIADMFQKVSQGKKQTFTNDN